MVTDTHVTSIVDDVETPALPTGATMFWKDDNGNWLTVEVIDCEPKGWGWCCIEWETDGGKHTKSVPIISLCDLDTYLDQQADYPAFEAADNEYRYRRSTGGLGYTYY